MNDYEAKQEARRARYEARAERAHQESDALAKRSMTMADAIPFGQPVLVGHYSEGRDRRFRAKIENLMGKAVEAHRKADYYADKAASVGTGGISGNDPDALEKLRAEYEQGQTVQARMKAVNAAIRKHAASGRDAQIGALMKLGLDEAGANARLTPDFCGRIGHASYELSNHSANLRRIAKRIKELESIGQLKTAERECKGFIYRESVEDNRVMFIYPGKPELETRTLLKRHGFKWSPSSGAWVRQMTANGIAAGRRLMRSMDA